MSATPDHGDGRSDAATSILRPPVAVRIAADTPLGIQGHLRLRATRTIILVDDVL